jgi:hypothetical protein
MQFGMGLEGDDAPGLSCPASEHDGHGADVGAYVDGNLPGVEQAVQGLRHCEVVDSQGQERPPDVLGRRHPNRPPPREVHGRFTCRQAGEGEEKAPRELSRTKEVLGFGEGSAHERTSKTLTSGKETTQKKETGAAPAETLARRDGTWTPT